MSVTYTIVARHKREDGVWLSMESGRLFNMSESEARERCERYRTALGPNWRVILHRSVSGVVA